MADQEYKKLRIRDRAGLWRFVMQKTLEEERNGGEDGSTRIDDEAPSLCRGRLCNLVHRLLC